MIIDFLGPRAFRCDCAVARTIVSWLLLYSASSFLNSAANPMIEKSPQNPMVDQHKLYWWRTVYERVWCDGWLLRGWIAIQCQGILCQGRETVLDFTMSINPCTECYIDNFMKGTTVTVSDIITSFANAAVREASIGSKPMMPYSSPRSFEAHKRMLRWKSASSCIGIIGPSTQKLWVGHWETGIRYQPEAGCKASLLAYISFRISKGGFTTSDTLARCIQPWKTLKVETLC